MAEVGPTSGPTWRLSHSSGLPRLRPTYTPPALTVGVLEAAVGVAQRAPARPVRPRPRGVLRAPGPTMGGEATSPLPFVLNGPFWTTNIDSHRPLSH